MSKCQMSSGEKKEVLQVFVQISIQDRKRADEFLKRSTHKKLEKGRNPKSVFVCDYCQKEFSFSSQLKEHVKIHTGQKDHHCNLSHFSTAYKEQLKIHIRRHLNKRPFKCRAPNCSASFATCGNFKSHQLVHTKNDKRISCSMFRYTTNREFCLTAHIKNVHSESSSFKCTQENCEYSTKCKRDLTRHSRVHFEEKNQVCPHPDCGFQTKWSSYLKVHMEIHSRCGEKRFQCHSCQCSSHYLHNLVRHIRRHTRKPTSVFICDYCQKGFSFSSQLQRNVKIHTGQKDNHCNFCDYSTACKQQLTIHIRRHLKQRPFKCGEPNCGASFTTSNNLKQHQLVHNKNAKKFSCSLCPHKTGRKDHLNRHMKNVHSKSSSFKFFLAEPFSCQKLG